ncbi:phosphatidylglycerol lysyltransferase domain-containing protein [Mucilaginibacter polytrichastri]|nr:phosphatidylglycerol lysyltransferase domain-containing protein [Mucilaginibacter polytrichastri]SFS78315.1 phosphatidylglycerol lysyltransferase [Mucilaginibacter polytrichastri]
MKSYQLNLKNKNYYFKEILGFLFLLFAVYFIRHQSYELKHIGSVLRGSEFNWILIGLAVTLLYIATQAYMYVYSFRTVGAKIRLWDGVKLFLKRNLISVFLPGGGVTSLAFFTKEIEQQHISKSRINFASYIYGFVGIFTVFVVAIPVMLWLIITNQQFAGEMWAFGSVGVLIIILGWATWSLLKRGLIFRLVIRLSPEIELVWNEIMADKFSYKAFIQTVLISLLIEFMGIAHLMIAMAAIGKVPSFEAAAVGYIIATLFLIISPFLRGMGAIELSLTLFLKQYGGFNITEAAAITLLYRLFEFWLPLVAGIFSFIFNKGNIFLRIFPAVLLFGLGMVNIISVSTPAIKSRVKLLSEFFPIQTIYISNFLVLIIGILLIITSAFLIRGLRNAWYFALGLCMFSLVGHITKAFDYEESLIALFVMIALLLTQRQYYIRTNRNLQSLSLGAALWIFAAVTIYGIVGFYYLDKQHFDIDFSLAASVRSTFDNFILLNSAGLIPHTRFARSFLYSINLFGVAAIALVFYAFIKPYFLEREIDESELNNANKLLEKYGNSPVDYFKTYADKLFFFSEEHEGFLAYRVANNFAIVLEEPVCEDNMSVKSDILREFERFCQQQGIKPAYYRVDSLSLDLFGYLGKKWMVIGQEAILDLNTFSLEGKDRKSMRNAVNSMQKKGFITKIYEAPIKEGLLQKLKLVSDEWLKSMDREELVFSQGMFDWDQLKHQPIITLENDDEKVLAFLNVIPDYAPGEATYDLIRKTADAPGGNMDVLIIELINYCKGKGYQYLNMGLAPMSGIEKARDLPERTIKFAYEKIQQFRHYRGLRDFKEKFDPLWRNKYLVYENSYDLLQLPMAISKVMKP